MRSVRSRAGGAEGQDRGEAGHLRAEQVGGARGDGTREKVEAVHRRHRPQVAAGGYARTRGKTRSRRGDLRSVAG